MDRRRLAAEHGDRSEPRPFFVFGSVALGCIGVPPSTIVDRSIIRLQRKAPREAVASLDDAARQRLWDIGRKLARWASELPERLSDVSRIDGLNDRAWDNWRPLLQIAYLAGDG